MCVFCKIVNQEIPAYRVFENDQTLAFLDINPTTPGHVLVIPKNHYQNIEAIPEKEFFEIISTVKKIAKLLKDKLLVVGYNILENNDPVAGQDISHLHFHIIPRSKNDGLNLWPRGSYAPGEAEEILKKLST